MCANIDSVLLCSGRLKELEEQYAKDKMEHERMFAQQREVCQMVSKHIFDV